MRRLNLAGMVALLACVPVGLAGCAKNTGSFDQSESVSTRLSDLVSFDKLMGNDEAPQKPVQHLACPPIVVLDGTAVHRIYNGAESNDTLRAQYSIGNVARECIRQGDQVAMKIGIEGQVLLGPAGSPGAFSVPIRIAIVGESDDKPAVSKLYAGNVNIAAGQTVGTFTVVTEPMLAPFIQQNTADDYTIKVGIDAAGNATAGLGKRKR